MNIPTLASTNASFLQRIIFGDNAASEAAAWSDGLFMMIFWFSAFFFVLLMGLMVYFCIKYRRKPGVAAEPSPHHNLHIEILWTVVPSASLLVMFVLGFKGYAMKTVSPTDAMELKVDAWKWAWKVTYPNGASSPETKFLSYQETDIGISSGLEYPIFYVPEDTEVKLRMHSQDVIHSFWIPEFRTKMDVIPNRYTGYGFKTPALRDSDTVIQVDDQGISSEIPGRDMWIFCAEYCGDEHSRMAATLRIVPREIYDEKIKFWGTPKDPKVLGQQLWKTMCAICHSIDGSPGTGPTWAPMNGYGFGNMAQMDDGTEMMRDDNYIRQSILDPNAHIVSGYAPAMPSFQGQLSDTDIEGLLAFIKSLAESDSDEQEDNQQADDSAGSDG